MGRFLITGLGNVGNEYENTRHNIGFDVVNALAQSLDATFVSSRYSHVAEVKYRNHKVLIIKPTTYMNLSGKAVLYQMRKSGMNPSELMVVTDDFNLPVGMLRIRTKGSSGGHNGLKNIEQELNTPVYSRLRIGIGKSFESGMDRAQEDFVLGRWGSEELEVKQKMVQRTRDALLYVFKHGLTNTMKVYNGSVDAPETPDVLRKI